MNAVLDTNIVISGFFWRGPPHTILEIASRGEIFLFTSNEILSELKLVLDRPKFAPLINAARKQSLEFVADYAALNQMVEPALIAAGVVRDPKDVCILACASAAMADVIVSGDSDLLSLRTFQGIKIVSASELVALF